MKTALGFFIITVLYFASFTLLGVAPSIYSFIGSFLFGVCQMLIVSSGVESLK